MDIIRLEEVDDMSRTYKVVCVLYHIIVGICLYICMTADTTGDNEYLYFVVTAIFLVVFIGDSLRTKLKKDKLERKLREIEEKREKDL